MDGKRTAGQADKLRLESIDVALSIMRDPDAKPAERLKAAEYALDQTAAQEQTKGVTVRVLLGGDAGPLSG